MTDIQKQFKSPPTLTDGVITMRKMVVTDADDMFEYASRPAVTEYLLWSPHPDRESTRCYLKFLQKRYAHGEYYDWAVTVPSLSDGGAGRAKMIGTCGYASIDEGNASAEIGYVINPSYRGKGYCTRAVAEATRFAFSELGLHRVYCRILEGNDASCRVCEKNGFTREAYFRSALWVKGAFRSYYVYSKINF